MVLIFNGHGHLGMLLDCLFDLSFKTKRDYFVSKVI